MLPEDPDLFKRNARCSWETLKARQSNSRPATQGMKRYLDSQSSTLDLWTKLSHLNEINKMWRMWAFNRDAPEVSGPQ